MSFRAIGFDLSMSATGIVALDESGEKVPTLVHKATLEYKPKKDTLVGLDRQVEIVSKCITLINDLKPDIIVVEGYSLNLKHASSVVPLVELGGLFRHMLKLDGHKWLDPRATEVKKFVLGKGTGSKDQIQMYVLHRWGFLADDNNQADAYALACIGLTSRNRLPGVTKDMLGVAMKLKSVSN